MTWTDFSFHLLMCSKIKSYRFGMTQSRVKDRIFIFWLNYAFQTFPLLQIQKELPIKVKKKNPAKMDLLEVKISLK